MGQAPESGQGESKLVVASETPEKKQKLQNKQVTATGYIPENFMDSRLGLHMPHRLGLLRFRPTVSRNEIHIDL